MYMWRRYICLYIGLPRLRGPDGRRRLCDVAESVSRSRNIRPIITHSRIPGIAMANSDGESFESLLDSLSSAILLFPASKYVICQSEKKDHGFFYGAFICKIKLAVAATSCSARTFLPLVLSLPS